MPISFNIPIGGRKRREETLQQGMALQSQQRALKSQSDMFERKRKEDEEIKRKAEANKALVTFMDKMGIQPKAKSELLSHEENLGIARAAAVQEEQDHADRKHKLDLMAARLRKKQFQQGLRKEESINDFARSLWGRAASDPEGLEQAGVSLEQINLMNAVPLGQEPTGSLLDFTLNQMKLKPSTPSRAGTATMIKDPNTGEDLMPFVWGSDTGGTAFPSLGRTAPADPVDPGYSPTQQVSISKELDRLMEQYQAARAAAGDPSATGPERRQATEAARGIQDRMSFFERMLRPGVSIQARPRPQVSNEVNAELPEIYQPQTQEDFDKIPSGAIYTDPEDGRRYRKP